MSEDHQRSIRVLLADDHPALRVGLRVLLDHAPDVEVVGEAEAGDAALRAVEALLPHVAVLDCQLPGTDGVSVARALREGGVPVRVVALSAYDDDAFLAGMHEAGALGYLLKNEAPGRIVAAVRSAARGEPFWSEGQLERVRRWRAEVAQLRGSLTPRERQVLALVAEGLTNREIALRLEVTPRTADFHVSNVLRKLDVASRVEAAVWAKEHLP
jgi:DNA-binding NarL/FixJ family response regulator